MTDSVLIKDSCCWLERAEPQIDSTEVVKEEKVTNEEKGSLKRENKTITSGQEQHHEEIKRIKTNEHPTDVQSKSRETHPTTNICIECSTQFTSSYLFKSFFLSVCDNCKEVDQKYKLITATEVRQKYLLTEPHLADESTGKLIFIEKRNPRNTIWSRMKLFLEYQVKRKAYAVFGGEEGLEKEAQKRREQSHKLKRRKYEKEMKQLRTSVKIASAPLRHASHDHSYGAEELVDAETEEYRKTCSGCGYVLTYEKL